MQIHETSPSLDEALVDLDEPRDRFLARVLSRALAGGWRISEDFFEYFSPGDVISALRNQDDLRVRLLVETVGLYPKIAERKSVEAASADLELAVEAGIADARKVLALIPLATRVKNLESSRLWRFAVDGDWLDRAGDDPSQRQRAVDRITFIVECAIREGLVTVPDLLGALDEAEIAEHVGVAQLQAAFAYALECARDGSAPEETRLVGSIDLERLFEKAALADVWSRIVVGRIAEPQGLGAGPAWNDQTVPDSIVAGSRVEAPRAAERHGADHRFVADPDPAEPASVPSLETDAAEQESARRRASSVPPPRGPRASSAPPEPPKPRRPSGAPPEPGRRVPTAPPVPPPPNVAGGTARVGGPRLQVHSPPARPRPIPAPLPPPPLAPLPREQAPLVVEPTPYRTREDSAIELSDSEIDVSDSEATVKTRPRRPTAPAAHASFPLQPRRPPAGSPAPVPRGPSEADRRRVVKERLLSIGRLPANNEYLSLAILRAIAIMYEEIRTRKGSAARARCVRECFDNESHLRAGMLALLDLLNPSLSRENPRLLEADNDALIDALLSQERTLWENARRGATTERLPRSRAVHVPPVRPPRSAH